MKTSRQQNAQALLEAFDLDAMVFLGLPNICYLSGFTGTDGALVLTEGACRFLTDSRYTAQAHSQVVADEIHEYRAKAEGIVDSLRRLGAPRRIGFEAEAVSYAFFHRLKEKGESDWTWMPVEEPAQRLRMLKDDGEIAAIREAAALNADVFEEILPQIRPGARERDIALALEFAFKRRGGEEKAFDFIVASGERGALPHGVASDRVIGAGELVTIDFGTRRHGYFSDETVTVAVGEVEPRLHEIYQIVLEAHDRAIEAVRPGVPLKDIDAVARNHIAEKGYGDGFGHGLGHGVGLEVHEYPSISPRSEEVAQAGMVMTIEPGIYLPGFGGVRIEDMVQVIPEGCRCLTSISKKFRSLPV